MSEKVPLWEMKSNLEAKIKLIFDCMEVDKTYSFPKLNELTGISKVSLAKYLSLYECIAGLDEKLVKKLVDDDPSRPVYYKNSKSSADPLP